MMREILFRGKNDNDEWVYGWLGHLHCCNPYKNQISSIYFTEISNDFKCRMNTIVDYKTVGQFTGLTDCGKKKLFEHDVVTAKFKSNGARYHFKIIFKDGAFLFDNGSIAVRFDQIRSAVKIGNVHDNPELWKVL